MIKKVPYTSNAIVCVCVFACVCNTSNDDEDGSFYTVLFFALKQIHCASVACDSQ